MKKLIADHGPKLHVEVSEQEKRTAKEVKKLFKEILSEFDDTLKVVFDFKAAMVQQRPPANDLKNKYNGRILRYRTKITKVFNSFLLKMQNALSKLQDILDPEMVKLRGIIVSELDQLSDGVESVLKLMKEPGKEGFTDHLEKICNQLDLRRKSIYDIIDDQFFKHIDYDILGRMRISYLKTKILKRSRLRKMAIRR